MSRKGYVHGLPFAEFIKLWNECGSLKELADAMNITRLQAKAAGSNAKQLHSAPLKNMPCGRQRTDIRERFFRFVTESDPQKCWLWCGTTTPRGYGQIGKGGAHGSLSAHRVSWIIHCGPIPEGLAVLHKCDVKRCVNPGHLFLGTMKENTADMVSKGRAIWQNAIKATGRRGGSWIRRDGKGANP
jgi:hypothetical protein